MYLGFAKNVFYSISKINVFYGDTSKAKKWNSLNIYESILKHLSKHVIYKPGVLVHASNSSPEDAEAGAH